MPTIRTLDRDDDDIWRLDIGGDSAYQRRLAMKVIAVARYYSFSDLESPFLDRLLEIGYANAAQPQ